MKGVETEMRRRAIETDSDLRRENGIRTQLNVELGGVVRRMTEPERDAVARVLELLQCHIVCGHDGDVVDIAMDIVARRGA